MRISAKQTYGKSTEHRTKKKEMTRKLTSRIYDIIASIIDKRQIQESTTYYHKLLKNKIFNKKISNHKFFLVLY